MRSSYQTGTQPVATAIVQTLRNYGEVPVGFLAKAVGRRPSELTSVLHTLQSNRVIRVERDKVELLNDSLHSMTR